MNNLKKDDTTAFHLQLLSKLIDINQYPFIKLIIENNITYQEYHDLFQLLDILNEKFALQKEEGFLDFTSLLIHFAGMLTEKLDPTKTIFALKKEGYFPSLMNEFIRIVECDEL
ncbi:DUF1878 family protein [Lentibacillus sp. Marseille-P4043]|uniref:DUF1878 family protein n=1 Tax=Lentibacillus sp. Marseille-P4043 TaxID=2040293 RepID=UPI000D0B27E6|nr:DUF1878 family protein [Lentibacillus sp. Marseille-P4043]